MEVPAIASHRSFIFMWVGNNEGLARGREVSLEYLISLLVVKTCRATRNPEFPRTGPDRTGPKPVRGRGTFLRIFSGRLGSGNFISGRSGSGNFISGRSGSGYFFTGV